jgi:hypothetical protein
MPKITKSAFEQSSELNIEQVVSLLSDQITSSPTPVFICGVNRKINIGNFENIDVYAGITLPLPGASIEDKEALTQMLEEAAAYGFSLVSKETGERYQLIKESQHGA